MPTARIPIDAAHRAASSDAHPIGAVTGLTDALAGKAAVAHESATASVHGITNAAGFIDKTGTVASDLPPYSAEFLPSTNWTLGAGWSGDFATGFIHAAGGGTATLTQSKAAVNATKYQIAYTVTGRTAGSFAIAFGGVTLAGITATGAWGPTSVSTGSLTITPTTDFDGTVVVSIKSITGLSTPAITFRNSGGTPAVEVSYSPSGVAFGVNALRYNTTGSFNSAVGVNALYANTTGSSNNAFGYNAGCYLADGTTANETATGGTYLGHNTRASAAGSTGETVIGYNAIGGGSNTVRLGSASVTHWLPGATNVAALGSSTLGFKELYLHDGTDEWKVTVNTSGALVTTKV